MIDVIIVTEDILLLLISKQHFFLITLAYRVFNSVVLVLVKDLST